MPGNVIIRGTPRRLACQLRLSAFERRKGTQDARPRSSNAFVVARQLSFGNREFGTNGKKSWAHSSKSAFHHNCERWFRPRLGPDKPSQFKIAFSGLAGC